MGRDWFDNASFTWPFSRSCLAHLSKVDIHAVETVSQMSFVMHLRGARTAVLQDNQLYCVAKCDIQQGAEGVS